ncbi:hypothetical protein [Brevibacterium sp. ZH18]|uniref:hypothetical protein n=1 Tax=Brevibacterium sp. ZH18 TaxID=2927784 RepID=UPI001F6109F0|nr:hypothetical protein [Brevibacterium sp. ZH18]MCI4013010.1 hypothetical protein [Brevibacterium sp. ZH18]
MTELDRYSEPVPPTGAIDASAAKRAIGKPKAEFWDVLFKEAVQNSWDARIGPKISFEAHIRSFSSEEQSILRDLVFRDVGGKVNSDLRDVLSREESTVLILQDRETRGLGGPTDASAALSEQIRSDFRNFIFDIGRDSRRAVGGGTYGFGKGILYEASSISTCLVYSQFEDTGGELNSRFIAASVTEQHEENDRRFTGRQWWGRVVASGDLRRVEPIEGEAARWLAEQIGLELPHGVTGTSIGIMSPKESATTSTAESKSDIARALTKAIKKWAWPHLVALDDSCTIDFSVVEDSLPVKVSIDDDAEYGPFAEAYRSILMRQAKFDYEPPFTLAVHRIPTDPAKNQTGWLGLKNIFVEGETPPLNNKIALMRGPKFVVDYMAVRPHEHGTPRVGVFLADPTEEVELAFAKSEPVTHDKWAREPGRARIRPIAWTLDDIAKVTGPKQKLESPNGPGEGSVGVARISRLLGTSLIGLTGSGAEEPHLAPQTAGVSSGSASRPRGVQALVDGAPRFVRAERELIIVEFPVNVTVSARADVDEDEFKKFIRPRVRVKAEAGQKTSPESEEATIRGWYADGAEIATEGGDLPLGDVPDDADLWLRIAHRHDVAVVAQAGIEIRKVAE